MLHLNKISKVFGFIFLLTLLLFCTKKSEEIISVKEVESFEKDTLDTVLVSKNIKIKDYFNYIDSIVNQSNLKSEYVLTEHVLVRNNPWIIDVLANTDYYRMIKKDSFIYNQKEMIVLKKGSKIVIPDLYTASNILRSMNKTKIVINIPEYKLRIFEDTLLLYEFPVRVGRNERKYLKMGNRITDLRTIIGNGKIVNHVKNPDYYNPANGKQYYLTTRDDKRVTKLPQIPWVVTEINGVKNGQLIHPTTNPLTLNKAYSNGCIGTNEADAWVIYYYAPVGTKLTIKYDLNSANSEGEKNIFKDIYGYGKITHLKK